MRVFLWLRQARHLALLFMVAAVLPVGVLSWLGLRLLQQDRDLEDQRIRQGLEDAADRVAARVEAHLTRIEASLDSLAARPPADLPNGAVFVVFRASAVDAWPQGRLLYYPGPPPSDPSRDDLFLPGEKLEFQARAYDRAVVSYRQLAQSKDPRTRAGALIRLARNLRRLSRHDEALSAYAELEALGDVPVGGVPAGLVGGHARCAVLEELGPPPRLLTEAEALCRNLQSGRWRLDRGSYEFYSRDLRRWLARSCDPGRDNESAALSAAVESLWGQWQSDLQAGILGSGRRTLWSNDTSCLVVWRRFPDRFQGLVAAPCYLESDWPDVWEDRRLLLRLVDSDGRFVSGSTTTDAAGPRVVRTLADTGLPWTLYLTSADPAGDAAGLAGRRRLLMIALAVMAIAVIAAGYMTGRATAREIVAARLQSDFVSAVSHEFRSPLTSMRHLTELLADSKVAGKDRRRQYYGMLARETRRLQRLVEGLLNFGRMEAGVMQYRPERIDPAELVKQVVVEYCDESQHDAHHVRLKADSAPLMISADSEALRSAVWNLLDNAAKYSPADSPVEVSVAHESGQVAIRVRDHGPGIPVEEQKRIFERFYRGTTSKSSGVKGTGIGLALVQHIIASHNGQVRVESAPGRGSTFTIYIPVVEES